MKTKQDEMSIIEAQAYDWVAIINSDGATNEEIDQFHQWLESDLRHKSVFSRLEVLFADISDLSDLSPLVDASQSVSDDRTTATLVDKVKEILSKPIVSAGFAATVFAFFITTVFITNTPSIEPTLYASQRAEIRPIKLNDGTMLTLGAKSGAKVVYTKQARKIFDFRGQAFFDVAHEPDRPFLIDAGAAQVEVIGTRFEVTNLYDAVRVDVHEGLVAVRNQQEMEEVRLRVGQSVIITHGGSIMDVQYTNSSSKIDWLDGRLVYVETPLRDAITQINRYIMHPIAFSPDVDQNLTVTGSFKAGDAENVVKTLATTHGLEIARTIEGRRIIRVQKIKNH